MSKTSQRRQAAKQVRERQYATGLTLPVDPLAKAKAKEMRRYEKEMCRLASRR